MLYICFKKLHLSSNTSSFSSLIATNIKSLKNPITIPVTIPRTPEIITRVLDNASSNMTSSETYNGVVSYTPQQATDLSVFLLNLIM